MRDGKSDEKCELRTQKQNPKCQRSGQRASMNRPWTVLLYKCLHGLGALVLSASATLKSCL